MEYGELLIKIIKSVVSKKNTCIEIPSVDEILEFAGFHKLENFVYHYLQSLDSDFLIQKNYQCFMKNVMMDSKQDYYVKNISDAFETEGIEHMVLKGSVLKNFYPNTYLRQSADIDMFVEPQKREKAREILTRFGFEVISYGITNHDEYVLNNTIYVEIHGELIDKKFKWYEASDNILGRRVKEPGYSYRYFLTNEDFYTYMIIHLAKHIVYGGAGIRFIVDIWIFLNNINIDGDLLRERLEEAGLTDFNRCVCALTEYWFCDKQPEDENVFALANFMIYSGWNGTAEQHKALSAMRYKKKRVRRYLSSIFWPKNKMARKYPILERLPIFLPLCWIHRALNAVLFKRKTVKDVISSYEDVADKEINLYKQFINDIGL